MAGKKGGEKCFNDTEDTKQTGSNKRWAEEREEMFSRANVLGNSREKRERGKKGL